MSEGESKSPIISELITHINQLESTISSLKETINDINDLQLVNKLDIINIRNEIEKLRMSGGHPQHAEAARQWEKGLNKVEQRISAIESRGSEKSKESARILYKLQERLDDLNSLKSNKDKRTEAGISQLESSLKDLSKGMHSIQEDTHPEKELAALKKDIVALKNIQKKSPNLALLKKDLGELSHELTKIRKGSGVEKDIASLKEEVAYLRRRPSKEHLNAKEYKQMQKAIGRLEDMIQSQKGNAVVVKKGKGSHSKSKHIATRKDLATLRKEIVESKKYSKLMAEKERKQTVSIVLKELKKMVK